VRRPARRWLWLPSNPRRNPPSRAMRPAPIRRMRQPSPLRPAAVLRQTQRVPPEQMLCLPHQPPAQGRWSPQWRAGARAQKPVKRWSRPPRSPCLNRPRE
jgi:hypothetical protein